MSLKKRIGRIIIGVILAIIFGIFAYVSCTVAVQSNECGASWYYSPQEDVTYGYDRSAFIERMGWDIDYTESMSLYEGDLLAQQGGDAAAEETAEAASEAVAEDTSTEAATVEEASALSESAQIAAKNAEALGLPAPPDIDVTEWQYMLVNSSNPLDPQDYEPENLAYLNMTASETDIQTSYNDQRCAVDARIAQALLDFALGCKDAGLPVYLSSGYRSYADQNYLYQRKISQGYSEDVAKTIVAYPGTSEHQTGLSCDITDYYRETKDSSLAATETYQWLCEHCAEYGFVVRYPEDKSGSADSITGIIYEPWHFRYVGQEAAEYMMDNNLCLEEFLALYEA